MIKLGAQLLVLVSLFGAAAYGGYWVRSQDAEAEIAEIKREYQRELTRRMEAQARDTAQVLNAERQINKELSEALNETEAQLETARVVLAANHDRNRVLANEVSRLLRLLGGKPAAPGTPGAGETEALRGGVHELFEVVGGAAVALAAEADEARAAGLTCERAYDAAREALSRIRLGGG